MSACSAPGSVSGDRVEHRDRRSPGRPRCRARGGLRVRCRRRHARRREAGRARTDWTAHQVARDTLVAMLTKLGATPVAASPAYELPFAVTSTKSAVKLAATLENGVTRAYLGLVAVNNPTLRAFAAQAMQTSANRATAWSGTTARLPRHARAATTRRMGHTAQLCSPSRRDAQREWSRRSRPRGRDSAGDRGRGRVQVVGYRDALRPGPPVPAESVLALVGVDVLLKGASAWVRDVHAGYPPRRSHEPGLKASVG